MHLSTRYCLLFSHNPNINQSWSLGSMVKKEVLSDYESIQSDSTLSSEEPYLAVHPLASQDGVIVKVAPPSLPANTNRPHVPCDIVLVIDVSFSMNDNAPAPMTDDDGNNTLEDFGLSILDLTKHAACTILETLHEGDRLGIVTFHTYVKVLQQLLPMNAEGKKLAKRNIDSMNPGNNTNLWQGICKGLTLFKENTDTGRVPAVMVLTDGQPNHMCPPQGYVKKLRERLPLPATIHTFGFGYKIKSALLKSIADISGGNYAFIPDAGMIGTVFIHAVAHLQSTFATKCSLEVTTPKSIRLKTTTGKTIRNEENPGSESNKLTIDLGNLQYNQCRDIYLQHVNDKDPRAIFDRSEEEAPITAELKYSLMQAPLYRISQEQNLLAPSSPSDAEVAYHRSRSMICDFLSSWIVFDDNGEYAELRNVYLEPLKAGLENLLAEIPAKNFGDAYNQSLMQDLVGQSPAGQVSLAISNNEYFKKWGHHYYLSLWNAHAKQLCNSFKDPGPQMYNADSPLFIRCRDALDNAFDTLPAPEPTHKPTTKFVTDSRIVAANPGITPANWYNSSETSCFAASSRVLLDDGREVPVCCLQKGASVQTPLGSRRVAAVMRTPVRWSFMCRVGRLLVTPWHPIQTKDGTWVFPADVAEKRVRYSGAVYSLLLQDHDNVDAHAVKVGGIWGVTLGHGLVAAGHGVDVRAHAFFGDHAKVTKSLDSLSSGRNGTKECRGVRRDKATGLICGLKGAHTM